MKTNLKVGDRVVYSAICRPADIVGKPVGVVANTLEVSFPIVLLDGPDSLGNLAARFHVDALEKDLTSEESECNSGDIYSVTLTEDFNEAQWWYEALKEAVSEGTPCQKRALAVVRNLLNQINGSRKPKTVKS